MLPLLVVAGAVGLTALVTSRPGRAWRLAIVLAAATTVLPFQAAYLARSLGGSPWIDGLGVALGASTAAGTTDVRTVRGSKRFMLADLDVGVGVLDCYWPGNLDGARWHRPAGPLLLDARRAEGPPGQVSPAAGRSGSIEARFSGWNTIEARATALAASPAGGLVDLVLDQNCHRHWRAEVGDVGCAASGHLSLRLPAAELAGGRAARLVFDDPWSRRGAWATSLALPATLLCLAGLRLTGRRRRM